MKQHRKCKSKIGKYILWINSQNKVGIAIFISNKTI